MPENRLKTAKKPKAAKPAKLADVAKLAGVSTATVSRALNQPDQLIESTRKKVDLAIKKLGYSPNFMARALAVKRTNTIGAVIPTMENAIFARGLQAFQDELRRNGITLLVSSSSYKADLEAEQIRTLAARGADGLLLIGTERDPEIYEFLDAQGIPALIAWGHDPKAPAPTIGFDNKAAMRKLADEVLRLGHKEIGIISAKRRGNDRARARVAAIKEAMAKFGLSKSAMHLIETEYGIEQGAEAFTQLYEQSPRPSIIMCGNDVLAAGALTRAREMGVKVPDQISITGFDDIELASLCMPALTTVHVPHRQMGREAAKALISMVNGNDKPQSLNLPTSLILRASLARPPKDNSRR